MRFTSSLGLAFAATLASMLISAEPRAATAPSPSASAPPRVEIAAFAGGCFWCMETQFEGVPGVLSVTSGYTGGHKVNPTYEEVGSGATGHYESVEIRYDPSKTSYDKLLTVFWHSIDPTQGDGQFCDIGTEYRSVIFTHGDVQRRLAEESKKRIEASHVLKKPIVTPIVAAGPFYRAEEYHQDFWKKDPVRYQSYRFGCGRDQRLAQLWGKSAAKPTVH
jgi:peptide-methionine (S)-S-oxide reductase